MPQRPTMRCRASRSGRSGTSPTCPSGCCPQLIAKAECRSRPRSTAGCSGGATTACRRAGHGGDRSCSASCCRSRAAARPARRASARSSSCASWPASTSTTAPTRGNARRARLQELQAAARHRASPTTRTRWPAARDAHRRTADDATIGTTCSRHRPKRLNKLRAALRWTERLPIWLTEFGFQTDPPDTCLGPPIKQVPAVHGRVRVARVPRTRASTSYVAVPAAPTTGRTTSGAGFQSGLDIERERPSRASTSAYQDPALRAAAVGARGARSSAACARPTGRPAVIVGRGAASAQAEARGR